MNLALLMLIVTHFQVACNVQDGAYPNTDVEPDQEMCRSSLHCYSPTLYAAAVYSTQQQLPC